MREYEKCENNSKRTCASKQRKSGKYHAHCTNYATVLSSHLEARIEQTSLYTDGTTAIIDNLANAHIFNDKKLFIGEIYKMDPSTRATTIGGTDHKPEGIGTAQVEWKDDQGCTHRYKFKKALYFPDLLVNIISITSLAEQLQDDEGTFVTRKRKYSILHGTMQDLL
eukprot:15336403-Ditylum_brightwellii.AAC.1